MKKAFFALITFCSVVVLVLPVLTVIGAIAFCWTLLIGLLFLLWKYALSSDWTLLGSRSLPQSSGDK